MSYEEILEEIDKLSDEEQKKLDNALEERRLRRIFPDLNESYNLDAEIERNKSKKPLFPGCGKDLIKSISDDFDEPIEDMKEYMY